MSAADGVVLDASAVLAVLGAEAGQDAVVAAMASGEALICAVNYSEVIGRLVARGTPEHEAVDAVDELGLKVAPFDKPLAEIAGALYSKTAAAGLSLGDRACLALSQQTGWPALTTDKAWAGLKFHPKIRLIR